VREHVDRVVLLGELDRPGAPADRRGDVPGEHAQLDMLLYAIASQEHAGRASSSSTAARLGLGGRVVAGEPGEAREPAACRPRAGGAAGTVLGQHTAASLDRLGIASVR
jgi:hypothetical protein